MNELNEKNLSLLDALITYVIDDLTFAESESLAALNMTDGVDNEYKVVFSRIAGEQATFVITRGEEIEVEEHGANISRYDRSLWNNYI